MEHFVYGVIAALVWVLFIYLNDNEGRLYWLVVTGVAIYALLMGCIAHYLFGFEDFGICLFIFGPLWAWSIGLVGYNILQKIRCTHSPVRRYVSTGYGRGAHRDVPVADTHTTKRGNYD